MPRDFEQLEEEADLGKAQVKRLAASVANALAIAEIPAPTSDKDGRAHGEETRCRPCSLLGCLACCWYVERQHRENDFAISVVGLGKSITDVSFSD